MGNDDGYKIAGFGRRYYDTTYREPFMVPGKHFAFLTLRLFSRRHRSSLLSIKEGRVFPPPLAQNQGLGQRQPWT